MFFFLKKRAGKLCLYCEFEFDRTFAQGLHSEYIIQHLVKHLHCYESKRHISCFVC